MCPLGRKPHHHFQGTAHGFNNQRHEDSKLKTNLFEQTENLNAVKECPSYYEVGGKK